MKKVKFVALAGGLLTAFIVFLGFFSIGHLPTNVRGTEKDVLVF